MIGHGCPHHRVFVGATRATQICRLVVAICVCALIAPAATKGQTPSAEPTSSAPVRVGLRVVWGGGEPTCWVGSISPSPGQVLNFVPLGMAPEDNTTISSTSSRLRIQQTGPGVFNGCDMRVELNLDAKLQLEFASLEPSIQWRREVTLRDVLQSPQVMGLDERGNRIVLQRAPGDEIQVEFEQDHLIFATQSNTQLRVRPVATGFSPSADGKLKVVRRHSIRGEEETVAELPIRSDARGEISVPDEISAEIPGEEGVYEWEFILIENQKRGPFNSERTVRSRRVQWVALDSRAKRQPSDVLWEETFSIDPTNPDRWTMRRQQNQWKLPSLYPAPLGQGAEVASVGQQKLICLAPRGWQAIALPIDRPGMPHIVEIEYLASEPLALGVSLIEPNALGQIPQMGTDSGIVIPSSTAHAGADQEPVRETHRITFWPSTNLPYLILANHDDRRDAIYGRIRVLGGPEQLNPSPAIDAAEASGMAQRQRLMFLERPTFVQAMNAPAILDSAQGQLFDDWNTVMTAADRLTQYLKANGYTGLAISVAAEGTAIYPSALIRPTPRWEGGVYFSSGQDPLRKDLLELLFRLFEREGLRLLPIVEFSGRLPGLEQMRGTASAAPFDLVNIDGKAWDQNAKPGARPSYNPLHSVVQNEFERVIEELASRYAGYRSFLGVGLGVQPRAAIAFPGDAWGWDEGTLQVFLQDNKALDTPFRSASLHETKRKLLAENRELWLAWRAQKLAEYLGRLQDVVAKNVPHGRLFVVPLDKAKHISPLRALSGSPVSSHLDDPLEHCGIDADVLRRGGRIEVLTSLTVGSMESTAELESGPSSQNRLAPISSGVLMEHPSSWAHFEQFEKQNPFGSKFPIVRVQQLTPSGIWNRRRYALALTQSDASVLLDGGATPPQGQELATRDWATAYARLPAVSFENVVPVSGRSDAPVIVRQSRGADRSYVYAVNHSPWEIDLQMEVLTDRQSPIQSLTSRELTIRGGHPHTQLSCVVPPFEIVALSIAGPAAVTDFQAQLPPQLGVRMQREIQDLKAKLVQPTPGDPLPLLDNPSFEPVDADDQLAGWQPTANSAGVRLDRAQLYDGLAALSLYCTGEPVGIQSQPFVAPRNGRVSVSLWMRTQAGVAFPQVRLSLHDQAQDNADRQAELAPVEGSDPSAQWTQFVAHFDNLPTDVRDLTLGVDLLSPGTVWIDRLEIHDRWLDRSEVQSLQQLLSLASYKLLEQGDSVGCLRILESYWPRFVDEQLNPTELPSFGSRTADENSRTLK